MPLDHSGIMGVGTLESDCRWTFPHEVGVDGAGDIEMLGQQTRRKGGRMKQ